LGRPCLLELTHRSLVGREGIRQHAHLPNATATPSFHRVTASFAIVFVVAVACWVVWVREGRCQTYSSPYSSVWHFKSWGVADAIFLISWRFYIGSFGYIAVIAPDQIAPDMLPVYRCSNTYRMPHRLVWFAIKMS
jgi:hypothetical protein